MLIISVAVLCSAYARDMICRAPDGIQFCDEESSIAERFLDSYTLDPSECIVFITECRHPAWRGHLYFHSNFITPGYKTSTKIATDQKLDLSTIVRNLVVSQTTTPKAAAFLYQAVHGAHKTKIKYLIDSRLVDADGTLALDLDGAENIHIVYTDRPPPRQLLPTNSPRGPPYMVRQKESVYVKVTGNSNPDTLLRDLHDTNFSAKDVRVVNFFRERAINDAFERSGVRRALDVNDGISEASLLKLFEVNQGGTIVMLGHSDGDDFLFYDTDGVTISLKIPLARLREMASKAGCDVVYLGCFAGRNEATSAGSEGAFNPRRAVFKLSQAINSNNYEEFLDSLAGDDLGLVLDDSAFRTRRISSRNSRETPEIKLEGYPQELGWENRVSTATRELEGGVLFGSTSYSIEMGGEERGFRPTWMWKKKDPLPTESSASANGWTVAGIIGGSLAIIGSAIGIVFRKRKSA